MVYLHAKADKAACHVTSFCRQALHEYQVTLHFTHHCQTVGQDPEKITSDVSCVLPGLRWNTFLSFLYASQTGNQTPLSHADIVVIGCGENIQRLPETLTRGLAAKGIAVEVASTPNAIATFNVFNEEGRITAGALLPMRSQMHTS